MADPNAFYSYQGGEPQPLPHEISYVESWGATTFRQGVETFTDEELEKAGYSGPFTKPSFDPEAETQEWSFEEKNWITTKIPEEVFWRKVRMRRNGLLLESDWLVVRAKEMGTDIPADWKKYRQSLRDITSTATDPKNITWPTRPQTEI